MRDRRRLDHSRQLEIDSRVDLIEEPDAVAQEKRDDVDLKLVEESASQILLREARTTGNEDILVSGDLVLSSTGEKIHPEGYFQDATVGGTGTSRWNVTLRKGTYKYVCDAHSTFMKGSFTVK